MLLVIRFWAPLLILSACAWRYGGGPERSAGIATLIACALSFAFQTSPDERFAGYDPALIIIDVSLLIVLIGIAFKANRLWPIPFAAMHLLAVLAHLGAALSRSAGTLGYAIATIGPIYLMMPTLALGVYQHQRRLRRFGVDASWRKS